MERRFTLFFDCLLIDVLLVILQLIICCTGTALCTYSLISSHLLFNNGLIDLFHDLLHQLNTPIMLGLYLLIQSSQHRNPIQHNSCETLDCLHCGRRARNRNRPRDVRGHKRDNWDVRKD